jgi:hypothetical protein
LAKGAPIQHGLRRPYTPAEARLLGRMPDRDLAQKLGRSEATVGARRRLLRMQGFTPKHRKPWTAKEQAMLGTLSDGKLAAKLDRSVSDVTRRRWELAIPSYRWKGIKAKIALAQPRKLRRHNLGLIWRKRWGWA